MALRMPFLFQPLFGEHHTSIMWNGNYGGRIKEADIETETRTAVATGTPATAGIGVITMTEPKGIFFYRGGARRGEDGYLGENEARRDRWNSNQLEWPIKSA
uniref:(northern house mosquito) hypothetical protein n=1 Tax=Culex pipiens TaxID=7175 RepID=A0A8D8ATW0_CULPI